MISGILASQVSLSVKHLLLKEDEIVIDRKKFLPTRLIRKLNVF